ncbi:MAG: S41 family peptidase, partial [FCB group bacterium]|nr:S41 family peptidase [FCB group bacterium]
MARYTMQLFGITIFALALIWFTGSGEAIQSSQNNEPVLWADTVHINIEKTPGEQKPVKSDRDTFLKDIKKLTQTAFDIKNQYMEDVNTREIINAGIRGMLSNLDRYSVLMEKSSYDALMETTHGKYEGLGMQIDARGNHIVIIAPIEGTPAYRKGLRAGDVIWEINGESTEGMSSADASKLMRGKAGTSVTLGIKREGIDDMLEFTVERAVIELKSVNYYGLVPGTHVGYVRLSRFAEETSHELRTAIDSLNKLNITGLIFDLRSNGGGLLDQAKETAELFLDKGDEIVYTKGKYENSERHYKSERQPIYPSPKPLIILVDGGTASASEIVSGAIQDWDRGLIVGSNTYGKGLVQQIFPISNDGTLALKLTTAKYYVPSGRCIQKPDKEAKPGANPHSSVVKKEESDSLTVSKKIFYTNGGRIVYGGGGIIPDVEIKPETWKPIEINLERKQLFFDFAIKYVADHPDVKPDLKITDNIVSKFKNFIKEKKFDYKTSLQIALEKLQKQVDKDGDSTTFKGVIDSMKVLVQKEKENDFNDSQDYIRRTIKREIVSAIAGERGVYQQIILKTDKAVQKAMDILNAPHKYTELLSKG